MKTLLIEMQIRRDFLPCLMTYFTSQLSYHIVWTMNDARKIQIFVKERRPANHQWNKISIWNSATEMPHKACDTCAAIVRDKRRQ